jgi:predicted RNase H-like HicB family nuclease
MDLKVLIAPGEDGGFVANVPALRGCRSQGATRQEALENIREAIKAWLEVEQDKADAGDKSGEIELVRV